ncbi:MAG: hypothetical protein D6820_17445 [Lentisphaerae bacterium]|nr:MAG: hypothetical protein D6820_17445 [Lentisphaerota bacterium]
MSEMNELYEQIEARIATSGKILQRTYACEPGCFAVVELVNVPCQATPRELITDVELAFEQLYLPKLKRELEVDSDYVPAIDLFHGTVVMAAAFGAEVCYPPGEWPWARPTLTSLKDVRHLRMPNLRKSEPILNYLNQIRWLQDRTEGRVPIKLMDLQSPFGVATQLIDANTLLVEMLEYPDMLRLLLEMIAEASVTFVEMMEETYVMGAYPGRCFPCVTENIGICVADDTPLIFLSPQMYEEFCLAAMQQIAAAVPGLFIHSCGDYTHQVDNLLKIPNLRSLQMHTGPHEIDSYPTWKRIRGKISMWSDTNHVGLGDEYAGRFWDCYNEYVLPRFMNDGDCTGLVILSPPADTVEERQKNHAILRQKLGSLSSQQPKARA